MTLSQWTLVWSMYASRWKAAVAADRERGEISTTTVILTFILAGSPWPSAPSSPPRCGRRRRASRSSDPSPPGTADRSR
jgi:hypothetical protein